MRGRRASSSASSASSAGSVSAARSSGVVRLQLAGDVLDPLEEDRQRLEVFRASHALQRLGNAQRAQRTSVTCRRDGPADDFARIAALLERVAHALVRERDDGVIARGLAAAAKALVRRGHEMLDAELAVDAGQLGQVHQDAHDARASGGAGRTDRASRSPSRRRSYSPTTVSSLSASDTAAHVAAACAELRARRRRIRFDADRQVLVVDRLPHLLGLPFFARVDAAHRALQLGELEDHVARQVGLRQPGRLRRVRGDVGTSERLASRSTRPASRCARPCRGSFRASCERAPCAAGRAATRACCLRSASQKNFASRRRAATTRSAFFAMTPLVRRLRVDDGEKRFLEGARCRSPPETSADGARASSTALPRAGRGTRHRRSRRRPPGNSTRSATSSTSAACSFTARGRRAGGRASRGRGRCDRAAPRDRGRRSARPACAWYSSKLRTLIERPARPLVARNRWP